MIDTIILFFCIVLFIGAYEVARRTALRHIKESHNADEACYYRKKFGILRLTISIIFGCIAGYVIFFGVNIGVNSVMVVLILVWSSYVNKHSLPLSGKRPNDVTKSKFFLYLRGFGYDDYSLTLKDLSKSHKEQNAFSEGRFINILKQYMPVYAVGMTKELNAPIGAERIYLNDAEWKQEVYQLMNKAKLIVVHLNDSDSCIWEIVKSNDFLNKVVFISSDSMKLSNIRKKLNTYYIYPLPIGIKENSLSYQPNNDNTYTILRFQNNEKSYITTTKQLMQDKFNLKRLIFTQRIYKIIGYMVGIILLIAFPILYLFNIDSLEIFAISIGITALMLLPYAIYNLLFIAIRNKKLK